MDKLEHWDIFVLRHRKVPNIYFHIVSCALFWLSIPLAILTHEPLWLIGFFISGLVGTTGHFLFRDGTVDKREATSSPQTVHFATRLVLLFLAGRYAAHVQIAEKKFTSYLKGEIGSSRNVEDLKALLGTDLFELFKPA